MKLIGGKEVALPLVRTENLCIYSFNLMGKGRLNDQCAHLMAAELLRLHSGDFDVIVAVEAKSLGLVQALAQLLGHDEYAVLRKSHKVYMGANALSIASGSITTVEPQRLWLDEYDAKLIKDRRVLFVDDVISTGKTKVAADQLLAMAGAKVTVVACVATEGKNMVDNPNGYVRLGHIPLYNAQEQPL